MSTTLLRKMASEKDIESQTTNTLERHLVIAVWWCVMARFELYHCN